jgi:uncharacterized phiE125 gp8 family phage protein
MWYAPTVTVAPASEPVTLALAKEHCKVDTDDHDTLVNGLIMAARNYVEAYCGSPLISRTITVKCDKFTDFAVFPVAPLVSVSSVSYVDGAGSAQTLSSSVYEVRSDGLRASVVLKSGQTWPAVQSGSRITVTAVVGYSTVPEAVRHAILLLISQWYDSRSDAGEKPMVSMPNAVESLLTNFRVFSV